MGYLMRQIAGQLNRHDSTIARELKRNTQQMYRAEWAEELVEQRRLVCRRLDKKAEEAIQTLQHYLKLIWSPEQISNTILKSVILCKTIYRWIYDGAILLGYLSYLRHKGETSKNKRNTRTL